MNLNNSTLKQQYKEKLSNFNEWVKTNNVDTLVYPENFGENMSIDETSLVNGEVYTVITNKNAKGKKGSLAALIKGTKTEVVANILLDKVPINTLFAVKTVTLDLANNMYWICRKCFKNAEIIADRFHVQQVVSEGVQEIRIKLRREAIDRENELIVEAKKERRRYKAKRFANGDTEKQLLARSRHLLFKTSNKWTETQKERSIILFKRYPELKKAYDLSIYFRGIFQHSKDPDDAKERLNKWFEKISRSNLDTLISAGNTIHNHSRKILNYFNDRFTNASAESFNAKLKGFRSLVRGIRDPKFFLFRIEKLYA